MMLLFVFSAAVLLAFFAVYYTFFESSLPEDFCKGKNVLITGASRGIGEQLAYQFVKYGANVFITGTKEHTIGKVANYCEELRKYSTKDFKCGYIALDMNDEFSPDKFVQTGLETLGSIDYLILNHVPAVPFGTWTGSADNLTVLDRMMNISFRAYVKAASAALPHLEKSHGGITVISSIAGKIGQPFILSYSSAKFALDGFFSGLRQELSLRNIDVSVTTCFLGLIATQSAKDMLHNHGLSRIAAMRQASPLDTANAIIRGTINREHRVYYPYLEASLTVRLKEIIPSLLEKVNLYLYAQRN